MVGLSCVCASAEGSTIYVSTSRGNDLGAGTKDAPLATISAGVGRAKNGDTVAIAEGLYTQNGSLQLKGRIVLQGGWRADFSLRDAFVNASRVTSNVPQAPLLELSSQAEDVTLDGLILDGSVGAYANTTCTDCFAAPYNPSVAAPLVSIAQSGRVLIHDSVIINAPGGGVRADLLGSVQLDNVALINTRPYAISATANCGYASPVCGDFTVRAASILWAWRESADPNAAGGSAIIVGAGVRARIEQSVIAYSDRMAIELAPGAHEVMLKSLVVFDNRAGDVGSAGKDGIKSLPINAASEAIGLSGAGPYGRMERLAMPWDPDYLQRFLNRASTPFYGTRVGANRGFMISPVVDAGLKTPVGSQMSYALAVSGAKPSLPVPVSSPAVVESSNKKKLAKHGSKRGKK